MSRVSGAVFPLLLYAFVARKRKITFLKPCVGDRPQLTIFFFHTHFNIIILETNFDPFNSTQYLTLMFFKYTHIF